MAKNVTIDIEALVRWVARNARNSCTESIFYSETNVNTHALLDHICKEQEVISVGQVSKWVDEEADARKKS